MSVDFWFSMSYNMLSFFFFYDIMIPIKKN